MNYGELTHYIKLLLIMLTGFAVMLGIVRLASVPMILARIIILPIFLGILWNVGFHWWSLLPPGKRVFVFLVLFPVGMILIMRLILGRDLFRHILGNFIYDVLKWTFFQIWRLLALIFYFPIWLIRRLLKW